MTYTDLFCEDRDKRFVKHLSKRSTTDNNIKLLRQLILGPRIHERADRDISFVITKSQTSANSHDDGSC
jgi:hypothetical protein